MARPKADPQKRRSTQVFIRLSALERAELEAKAETAGKSLSDFTRCAALGRRITPVATSRPDAVTMAELRAIGVNLNQIARALNAGREGLPASLVACCTKLEALFDRWLDYGPEDRAPRP